MYIIHTSGFSLKGKSSVNLHIFFLINVSPVDYRRRGMLTDWLETQCFDVSPFCSQSIYIYTANATPVVVTRDKHITSVTMMVTNQKPRNIICHVINVATNHCCRLISSSDKDGNQSMPSTYIILIVCVINVNNGYF